MKTRADIVQALGRLDATDRIWIVDRLPVSARHALLDERGKSDSRVPNSKSSPLTAAASGQTPTQLSAQSSLQTAVAAIETSGASSIVAATLREPMWVVHALLQYKPWAWREELLRALSARQRSDLMQLDASAVRYSAKSLELLVTMLATQVRAHIVVVPEAVSTVSSFDKLVGAFRAKFARQRMRLRA